MKLLVESFRWRIARDQSGFDYSLSMIDRVELALLTIVVHLHLLPRMEVCCVWKRSFHKDHCLLYPGFIFLYQRGKLKKREPACEKLRGRRKRRLHQIIVRFSRQVC